LQKGSWDRKAKYSVVSTKATNINKTMKRICGNCVILNEVINFINTYIVKYVILLTTNTFINISSLKSDLCNSNYDLCGCFVGVSVGFLAFTVSSTNDCICRCVLYVSIILLTNDRHACSPVPGGTTISVCS
jgi:hypothetical protein